MTPSLFDSAFEALPLVAILRGIRPQEAEAVGAVLYEEGFRMIEVPLNSPQPLESIELLSRSLPADALLGAGTVLGVQAVQDTVAGQTQILMNGMLATLPHVQSGKLKVLGVSKSTRMPLIGDVPTIAEQGVAGFESGTWQGVRVAKGTPDAIVQRLNKELITVIRAADIRSRLAGQGAEVVTMAPAEEEQFFGKERTRWAKVVADAGIKLDYVLPQSARTSCRFANPLTGGTTSGPAKPVPR